MKFFCTHCGQPIELGSPTPQGVATCPGCGHATQVPGTLPGAVSPSGSRLRSRDVAIGAAALLLLLLLALLFLRPIHPARSWIFGQLGSSLATNRPGGLGSPAPSPNLAPAPVFSRDPQSSRDVPPGFSNASTPGQAAEGHGMTASGLRNSRPGSLEVGSEPGQSHSAEPANADLSSSSLVETAPAPAARLVEATPLPATTPPSAPGSVPPTPRSNLLLAPDVAQSQTEDFLKMAKVASQSELAARAEKEKAAPALVVPPAAPKPVSEGFLQTDKGASRGIAIFGESGGVKGDFLRADKDPSRGIAILEESGGAKGDFLRTEKVPSRGIAILEESGGAKGDFLRTDKDASRTDAASSDKAIEVSTNSVEPVVPTLATTELVQRAHEAARTEPPPELPLNVIPASISEAPKPIPPEKERKDPAPPLPSEPDHQSIVVYVLDDSRSMEGDRAVAARREAMQELESLKPGTSFCVLISHSTGCDAMIPEGPLPATSENVQAVSKWMTAVKHSFGSDPTAALRLAIKFQPQAIWLVSDGEFSSAVGQAVRDANKSKVRIHTVGIHSQKGEQTLRQLAEDNGGTCRLLPKP